MIVSWEGARKSCMKLVRTFAQLNLVASLDGTLLEVTVGETLEVHQCNL